MLIDFIILLVHVVWQHLINVLCKINNSRNTQLSSVKFMTSRELFFVTILTVMMQEKGKLRSRHFKRDYFLNHICFFVAATLRSRAHQAQNMQCNIHFQCFLLLLTKLLSQIDCSLLYFHVVLILLPIIYSFVLSSFSCIISKGRKANKIYIYQLQPNLII